MRINPFKLFNGSFVPEWLMTTSVVSSNAKIIYARLCRYAGENGRCYPKLDELADEVGLPLSTMRRALDELVAQRMVETARRGLGLPNDYYFLWHELMGNQDCPDVNIPDCPPMDNLECPPVSTPISRESGKRVRQENTPVTPQPGATEKKAPRRANPAIRFTEHLGDNPTMPREWAEWAGAEFGWDAARLRRLWADFSDYWTSGNAAGGGRKADWPATWRGHCRRAAERQGNRSGASGNGAGQGGYGSRDIVAAASARALADLFGVRPANDGGNADESAGGADPWGGGEGEAAAGMVDVGPSDQTGLDAAGGSAGSGEDSHAGAAIPLPAE